MGQVFFTRVNYLMSLGKPDEALESLGKYLESRPGDDAVGIVVDMLKALDTQFKHAENDGDLKRMAELAAHRVTVSDYLIKRVEKASNPKIRQLLPAYRKFYAEALQQAAALATDPVKKNGYYTTALQIFEADYKSANDEQKPGLALAIARLNYDLGKYDLAQPTFIDLVDKHLVGKPLIEKQDPDSGTTVFTPNDLFWEVNYKLLKANVELAKAKHPAFKETLLDDTKGRLKSFYIQFGAEPGGAKWSPKFEALRKEILPDWAPDAPATQPATGATQPAVTAAPAK
jgi:hypothetical protein